MNHYQNIQPADTAAFCSWLGINETLLHANLDTFRNPQFWTHLHNEWHCIDSISENVNEKEHAPFPTQQEDKNASFILTPSKVPSDKEFIYKLFEKGFVLPH